MPGTTQWRGTGGVGDREPGFCIYWGQGESAQKMQKQQKTTHGTKQTIKGMLAHSSESRNKKAVSSRFDLGWEQVC